MPARNSTIANPVACHTAAMMTVQITMSRLTIQSNRKLVQPMSRTSFWMPRLGLSSQDQTVPVTTKDTAMG